VENSKGSLMAIQMAAPVLGKKDCLRQRRCSC
jgi:hypothetical protein